MAIQILKRLHRRRWAGSPRITQCNVDGEKRNAKRKCGQLANTRWVINALAFIVWPLSSFFSIFFSMAKYIFWFVWFIFSSENWKLTRRHYGIHCSLSQMGFVRLLTGDLSVTLHYDGGDGGSGSLLHPPFAIQRNFDLDSGSSTCCAILQTEPKKKINTNCHLLESFTSCLSPAVRSQGKTFFPYIFLYFPFGN